MKAVISYFMVFISAVSYMVLFDRNAGGIMTVFLIVIPAVSVFLTLMARKKLLFSLDISDDTIKKDKKEILTVRIIKDTVLPVPIVSFSVNISERFEKLKHDIYRFSMSENKELEINIDIFPKICGRADISINDIFMTDYLGIFRFKINADDVIIKNIFILPDMKEIEDGGEILRSIYSSLPDNDDDEAVQSVYGKSAFPGYEYRNYIPGDPLKKINWKLSSKRNHLFVRMDEASGMTLPEIILDTSAPMNIKDKRTQMLMEEKIIESSLSLLTLCVRHGIECVFTYNEDGNNVSENIISPADVERMADKICRIKFGKGGLMLSSSESSKSNDINIVYTLNVTDTLVQASEQAALEGNNVKVIMPECMINDVIPELSDVWLIRDDYNLYRVS